MKYGSLRIVLRFNNSIKNLQNQDREPRIKGLLSKIRTK